MSEAFDIYNLIFLGLAVFVFLRLRNVLGRRTGNERRPNDPYSQRDANVDADTPNSDDRVVPIPGRGDKTSADNENTPAKPNWGKIAPAGTPLEKGLLAIYEKDDQFDPAEFLDGAKIAYEMIVMAFADGDQRTLKKLLSDDVFQSFNGVIDGREERGEVVESNFVGIEKADILEASLKNNQTSITVKFLSELVSATRNSKGDIIEGDPKKTREVVDIWTFMRDLSSNDPNWNLIATEAAN